MDLKGLTPSRKVQKFRNSESRHLTKKAIWEEKLVLQMKIEKIRNEFYLKICNEPLKNFPGWYFFFSKNTQRNFDHIVGPSPPPSTKRKCLGTPIPNWMAKPHYFKILKKFWKIWNNIFKEAALQFWQNFCEIMGSLK